MSDVIRADTAPRAVGSYPHARRVGHLLFLSGIGPRSATDNSIPGNAYDADGGLACYDIVAQCHSVFANVRAVLEASGASWNDLVDVTVYLTDMTRDFKAYNAVWAEYFPARICVESNLAMPSPNVRLREEKSFLFGS